MAVKSIVELVEALAAGTFERIKGSAEGQEMDFKSAPYQLDTFKGRWELAKDVAAFANSRGGGCILIGAKTEKHQNEVVETVSDLSLVPKSLVNVPRYRALLAEMVYPSPHGVEIKWFPENGDEGLLLIRVPAAQDGEEPLLLRSMVTTDGGKCEAVGVPRRNEDRTDWDPAEKIHGAMVSARMAQTFLVTSTKEKEVTDLDNAAIMRSLMRYSANKGPMILLQSKAPKGTDLLPHLIGPGSIAEAAQRWTGLRPRGFGLHSHAEPRLEGSELHLGGSRWQAVVTSDGWFEFLMPIDPNFLGWGMDRQPADPARIRINTVAFVEVVLDYFRFQAQVLVPKAAPGAWRDWVEASNLDKLQVELNVGSRWDDPEIATTPSCRHPFDGAGIPEQDAFEVLWRLLLLWGLDRTRVPFSADDRIDPAQIIALRG